MPPTSIPLVQSAQLTVGCTNQDMAGDQGYAAINNTTCTALFGFTVQAQWWVRGKADIANWDAESQKIGQCLVGDTARYSQDCGVGAFCGGFDLR